MSDADTHDLDKHLNNRTRTIIDVTMGSALLIVGIALTAGATVFDEDTVVRNVLDNLGLAFLGVGVLTFLLSAFVRQFKERMAAPAIEANAMSELADALKNYANEVRKQAQQVMEKAAKEMDDNTQKTLDAMRWREARSGVRDVSENLLRIQHLLTQMRLDILPDDESERTKDRRAAAELQIRSAWNQLQKHMDSNPDLQEAMRLVEEHEENREAETEVNT